MSALAALALACTAPGAICAGGAAMPLVDHGQVPTVLVDAGENPAVRRAAAGLHGGARWLPLDAERHVVRVWAVDPGVVAERLMMSAAAIDPLPLDWPERGT